MKDIRSSMSSLPANRGISFFIVKYKRSAFALNMFRIRKASFIPLFLSILLFSWRIALKPNITSFRPRKNRKAIFPKTLMKVSKYKLLTLKLEKPNPTNNSMQQNTTFCVLPIITLKVPLRPEIEEFDNARVKLAPGERAIGSIAIKNCL